MIWSKEVWAILGGLGGFAAIILLLMECKDRWNHRWNRRILYTIGIGITWERAINPELTLRLYAQKIKRFGYNAINYADFPSGAELLAGSSIAIAEDRLKVDWWTRDMDWFDEWPPEEPEMLYQVAWGANTFKELLERFHRDWSSINTDDQVEIRGWNKWCQHRIYTLTIGIAKLTPGVDPMLNFRLYSQNIKRFGRDSIDYRKYSEYAELLAVTNVLRARDGLKIHWETRDRYLKYHNDWPPKIYNILYQVPWGANTFKELLKQYLRENNVFFNDKGEIDSRRHNKT